MKVIEYFDCENSAFWLEKMEKCDWDAGKYLAYLLKTNGLCALVGEGTRVLLLVDGEELISQCVVYPMKVRIFSQIYDMGGLTGVGTYPEYANHGLMNKLLERALLHNLA